MKDDMAALLVSYYRVSLDTARELLLELRDKRSLQSLAGYRAARAVPATPPTIFTAALRGIASQASVLQDAGVHASASRAKGTETTNNEEE